MDKTEFINLVQKYLEGNTNVEEEEKLLHLYEMFQESTVWPDELGSKKDVKSRIFDEIQTKIKVKEVQRFPLGIKRVLGYSAAIVAIAMTILIFRTSFFNNVESELVPKFNIDKNSVTLTLANGEVQVLTKDRSGKIYDSEGKEIVSNNEGQLDYSNTSSSNVLAFNELNVPYGKRFDIVLSDGTEVKLNAGTWLRYPVKFLPGKERKIYFKGEAYFDVAKDIDRPFIVNMNELNVEVLGTEFNMSFFPEDQTANTVLVEGLVSIYGNDQQANEDLKTYLKPGQLAAWDNGGQTMKVSEVDTSIYTAWKDGILLFKNTSFDEISKKLERYMDVRIVNEFDFLGSEKFTASFDEEETIENVLEYFSEDTPFNYTIEDKIITIRPKD